MKKYKIKWKNILKLMIIILSIILFILTINIINNKLDKQYKQKQNCFNNATSDGEKINCY